MIFSRYLAVTGRLRRKQDWMSEGPKLVQKPASDIFRVLDMFFMWIIDIYTFSEHGFTFRQSFLSTFLHVIFSLFKIKLIWRLFDLFLSLKLIINSQVVNLKMDPGWKCIFTKHRTSHLYPSPHHTSRPPTSWLSARWRWPWPGTMSASGLCWTVSQCPGEYELALSIYQLLFITVGGRLMDVLHNKKQKVPNNILPGHHVIFAIHFFFIFGKFKNLE